MEHHKAGHEEIYVEHLHMDASSHQDEDMTLLCYVWVNKQQRAVFRNVSLNLHHGLCQYFQSIKHTYSYKQYHSKN